MGFFFFFFFFPFSEKGQGSYRLLCSMKVSLECLSRDDNNNINKILKWF